MRLAGVAKGGFYPANPNAIALLAKHLQQLPPIEDKPLLTTQILDPCAGEGAAVQQLTAALDIPEENVYCVELDAGRTEQIKQCMPKAKLIGPATFIGGCMITGYSFGLAYVNPPFDWEMGGGRREEELFCDKATKLLTTHGIMVLVVPLKALVGNRGFVEMLDCQYEDLSMYKFPDGNDEDGKPIRPYNEIVVIGRKRRQELPRDTLYERGELHKMSVQFGYYVTLNSLPPLGRTQPKSIFNGSASFEREDKLRVFQIPRAWKPNTFKKYKATEEEMVAWVKESPLNKHLEEVTARQPDQPPLPLDKGHLGLMLASGKLNGVVEGPNGVHIVRGSSHKVEYHNTEASTSEVNPETGAVSTKDVFSEKPVTVIRCVDYRGTIWTHSNNESKADENADD